jgi:teichuronic acid exporter
VTDHAATHFTAATGSRSPSPENHGDGKPRPEKLRVTATRAALWALLDRWITRLLTTVVFVILGRLLSVDEFGLVALALVVRNFFGVFIDGGFSEALIRAPSLSKSYTDTAFWSAVATGTLLTILTVAGGPFIANSILDQPDVAPLLQVLGISLVVSGLSSTQSALLQRDLKFRQLAVRRAIAQVVSGTVAIVVAFLGAGAWSIVVQTVLLGVVGTIVLWRVSDWRPGFDVEWAAFKSLSAFGVSMVAIDVLTVIQQQADNFVVGRQLGVAALGVYAVAFRFYFLIADVTTSSMKGVALATFARFQQDQAAMRRALMTATRLTALVAIPAFVALALIAPELIRTLVGGKWAPAIPVLRALSPSGPVLCLSFLDISLLIALGRSRLALGISAAGVAVRVVGYLVGVQHGVIGVAVGLTTATLIYWPVRLLVLRRLIGLSTIQYTAQLRTPVVASVPMAAGLVGVNALAGSHVSDPVLLIASSVIGGLLFVAATYVIDRDAFHEVVGLVRVVMGARGGKQPSGAADLADGSKPT